MFQEKTENARMLTFLSDNLCVTSVVCLLGRVIYKLQGLQTVKLISCEIWDSLKCDGILPSVL